MTHSVSTPATGAVSTSWSPDTVLHHWRGHRALTRRTIEAFPEEHLFSFKPAEPLRSFGEMMLEVAGMIGPTLAFLRGEPFSPSMSDFGSVTSKTRLLAVWDETDKALRAQWPLVDPDRLWAVVPPMPTLMAVPYLIDNEVHHRAQGFVYLRLLGVEPPAFYER